MSDFFYSSIYKDLTKNVQIRFDAASEMHKKLFDNVYFEKYLDWDAPSIGLNFEEIVGSYGVTIAAPTIGDNSKEPVLGSNGVQTMREKILNHAITKGMTMQTYRKVLDLQNSHFGSDQQKRKQLVDLMFGDVQSVVNSVLAKIDLIFLQGLSNGGICELDATTNPEGGVQGTINYNQPASNIAQCSVAWEDGKINEVDCFEDMQALIDKANQKVVLDKILITPELFAFMTKAKKTREMLWGTNKSGTPVHLNDLNNFMQSNGLPTFEIVRRFVNIQTPTGVKSINAFNRSNIVFIPAGKLGVVKNAYANSELKPENGVAYSNYGRIRVSQWGVGESQNSNSTEFVKAEAYALPVITEMNGIYTLKTGRTYTNEQ